MIFHIPIQIDLNKHSASQIRPQKMIQAFIDIGYDVDLVMGFAKDRKEQIHNIKEKIKNGIKYDFLYSENSTMPTALTEKHHLPTSPFLDFSFLKYCHNNNIKIGLFYRDIYWKLDSYKKTVPLLKRKFAEFFYNYDLKEYQKFVDILYVPSLMMYEYMKYPFNNKVITLPPGLDIINRTEKNDTKELSFIYIGGSSDHLNLELFLDVISSQINVNFNLCTREDEWKKYKKNYNNILKNTTVYHKQGLELDEIYNNSDISIYFIKPNEFGYFALGLKLFEYMSHLKPIIAVKGTAIGNFVESNDIGWSIDYDKDKLSKLIDELKYNKAEIMLKKNNMKNILLQNTWEARASQVQKDLLK